MRAAVAFLTPFGGAVAPGRTTLRWFPLVGAGLGAVVGLVWWGSSHAWRGALVPAALAVAADLVVTGMLHLDGLADSADGLLPHLSRPRRLEVMAQPDVGAFGLATTAAVLLARFSALASLRPDVALVAGVWCASRSLMLLGPVALPYARPTGLATAFLGDRPRVTAGIGVLGLVAGAALAAAGRGGAGVAGVGGLVVAGVALGALARARIGGYTGDVLGAGAVIGETVALLVAAARW
ncbi:adenosylcobinamide-GDP ribazoletransferase [Acidiferrimicrobium sp. IK]|uniref:adenosylcobinamide-GDP ribazoletransferase n=1 Tax=Acidiferrimicrobium sp. IK TaxID=2871700 RepID=UPI0021CB6328|nr:adenosylcobinamide-GDP ribazoletransferase [Acidiferrimicrobium sp. IK]MCU4186267.1 adenosylcobinamide-GDP ribazoletransferase [Acidiferrimicrobium sp. IK]